MVSDSSKKKVAVITGSSMGIGKAIAIELAQNGVKIVLNGRDKKKLNTTKNEMKGRGFSVVSVAADIRNSEECAYLIEETMKAYGQLDILINNAGLSSRGSVALMATSNIKELMETNYMGSAYMSKYATPHLKKSKGHIIFINSISGFRGMPYNSAYAASKMAQVALADAIRIELYDANIHVGIAYVGYTENDPKKVILDVDGSLIYLPKRTNVKLSKPQHVAKRVYKMIVYRKNVITLTTLGHGAHFMLSYLPKLSDFILRYNRKKIEKEYTLIGGDKIET